MIEYEFDAKELEKMMAAVDGGSNPEEGDGPEQEAPPSVMGQPESRDPAYEIKVLGEVMPQRIPPRS